MLPALLLMLQTTPLTPTPTPDVVVTGERLRNLHDQCRRGKCSPLRDAQASIAWAESQFRDGRYLDAKNTLRDAAARAKRYAAAHPKPAAAVHEAYATVSWQEGDQDRFREAVAARVRILRDHLPADDPHRRAAALALGDMWLKLGQPLEAERAYVRAERDALTAGHGEVAVRARLARARVRTLMRDRAGALELLRSTEALPGAERPAARVAIRAMRLRFAAQDGDKAAVERAAGELRGAGFTQPVLVWAPPYPQTATGLREAARGLGQSLGAVGAEDALGDRHATAADITAVQWADIGFWVRPDGRTAEPEVLRGSRETAWTRPYLRQIAQRRYAPFGAAGGDDPGAYRIERFTLRGQYDVPKGSLIRRRTGATRLEVLDLTDPNARVTARK